MRLEKRFVFRQHLPPHDNHEIDADGKHDSRHYSRDGVYQAINVPCKDLRSMSIAAHEEKEAKEEQDPRPVLSKSRLHTLTYTKCDKSF